jgi:hypothetical protein
MGDKISTGDGGRAEVQLDYANILRLGPNSQATIANFTKKFIQVQVGQGIVNYSVFGESEAEPEIDTPNVALHPAHQDGVFRIELRSDGDSIVILRKGEAQISTPQGIADIKAGDMATVRGSGADARYKIAGAPAHDDWDNWNIERDRMIHNANAWNHTNKYYVGSEDLDTYGHWQNVPDYGQVWQPDEPEGWAPYRDGNWVWEPYYGLTTTDAGFGMGVRGDGGPDRCGVKVSTVHSGRRPTFRSSDSAADLDLALDLVGADGAASDGCQSVRVTAFSHGGAVMQGDLERSDSIDWAH